jgi:hypothetical protein
MIMMSGEARKQLRKKLVEAMLCYNDKRRLEQMADSKALLREVRWLPASWCLVLLCSAACRQQCFVIIRVLI